ncbi:hypothetical protein C8R44DRAFT_882844 [Mycena epipterygia]|nr:hypothetical protein C8R44DRAFT_882844 [Mycena epipterygia]
MSNFTMFPTAGLQAMSALLYFLGVTILTLFFSRRLLGEDLSSRQAWSRLTWPRICILLVFLDSYLFLFSTGFLIFGVGLQTNATACAAGILLCVCFYTSSKILIYAFLTEKVYIVWDTGRSRLRSPVYLICMVTVCLYSAVILLVFIGRINEFRAGDGACVLGVRPTASLPLLSYDLYINVLLTALFSWPLLRSKHSSARLRRVATRTLFASAVALSTSTVNITVLTIMKGHELGWVCLTSCGTDVIFNAAALFWVTGGTSQASLSASGANRQLSDSHTNSNANVVTLSVPPTPVRNSFRQEIKPSNMFRMGNLSPTSKEFQLPTPPIPARSIFRQDVKPPKMFKMGNLSPTTTEFQIHVTTESQVSTSPPTSDLANSQQET